MQFGGPPPVTGIVYNTTLSRPDAALSLALLYGLEGKREARVASIALTESSLAAATFADAVYRFYQLGPLANANRVLPIGLAADRPLPADPEVFRNVLARIDEKGESRWKPGVRRVSDTAEVTALMRNSLTYFPDTMVAVVLSAPATYLAKTMGYPGVTDLLKQKVRVLVLSECQQDPVALRRVLAGWPSPIVFCGREVGEQLPFPAASLDADFAWSPVHPVADYYRAARAGDSPMQDPAAILFAARSNVPGLQATETGTIEVSDSGAMRFVPGPGNHKRLSVDSAQKETVAQSLRAIISAKPVPPPPRRRFTPEEIEQFRKQREEEQRRRDLEDQKKLRESGART